MRFILQVCCCFFVVHSNRALEQQKSWPHPGSASILWMNTTYQAEDNGIQIQQLSQCNAWMKWWSMENKDIDFSADDIDLLASKKKVVSIKSKQILKKYQLPEGLLDRHKEVHVNFEEICKNHSRILWINSIQLVRRYKLNTGQICEPYRRQLNPSLSDIADMLANGTAQNQDAETPNIGVETAQEPHEVHANNGNEEELREDEQSTIQQQQQSLSLLSVYDKQDGMRRIDSELLMHHTGTNSNQQIRTDYIVDVDEDDGTAIVTIRNKNLADHLGLNASEELFSRHEAISLPLRVLCNGDAPELIHNETPDGLASIDGLDESLSMSNIGIHFDAPDWEIRKLAETLRNDTKLNDILRSFDEMSISEEQPLASTFILPVLKRAQYDPRSPPTLFTGQTVDVRVGLHIQSMSNFELTTMDYDMDVWLRIAWRDPRLTHGLDRPILINEETFLKKIWRPDPFFANAKLALFHRVTYLNFYMFVFPDGEIFFESRLYLKPSCQFVLCKYPHDSQTCSLRISSIAFTKDVVKLRWFSNLDDAIRRNKHVQLPELYVTGYSKHDCNGNRKSGNFSCLEARFYMKRNLGYHMAQTYIPTAMCVLFSWISVWLPEEFVDGRIFVSLTVFLTLSAESSSAKEILPKVSYTKAVDIWFGFTATFVFTTMLQSLVVISLEHTSGKLRKEAEEGVGRTCGFQLTRLMLKSKRYHKLARAMDTYCKFIYPLIFVLFLIIYRFVIIEGEETKCLR